MKLHENLHCKNSNIRKQANLRRPPVLQIVFIRITSCKVQDYVVIIRKSKSRGTLAFWHSQGAAHSCRLVLLDYFLSLLITLLCCVAKQQMGHYSFSGHSLLDWLLPSSIIKKKYKKPRIYIVCYI